jgi:hypothetical protein
MPGSFTFAVRVEVCAALISVALLAAGCGEKSSSASGGTNASGGSVVDAPGDYLKGAVKAQRDATMTLDTNALTKAIDRFNVELGRNPKDLDELVKERYISAVPKPPFGTKIVYDAASGRVNIVADR